ncbi:MAG: carbon-nitrogen family hydrolase [Verrucomicrobia bacterium]|nr:carbon-nitrogen family hydrolase [Verrucomicrobiota bacterium]
MNALLAQMDIVWEDPSANLAKLDRMLAEASPGPDTLVVIPEMATTGFTMNLEPCRRGFEQTVTGLKELAARYRSGILAGVARVDEAGQGRNQAWLVRPDGMIGPIYNKLHPFSLGGEPGPYPAGDQLVGFEWGGFKVSPFICYDLRFPEIFRAAALGLGSELLVVIASWPIKRAQHWVTLLQARAIENQAYVIGVNRCGTDPNFTYPGRSMVVDPHGVILVDASDVEGTVSARLDRARVASWREQFPALRDARPTSSIQIAR